MTKTEYNEAMSIWIEERMAILEYDSSLYFVSEAELRNEATIMWDKYRRHNKLFMNEQVKL